MTKDNFGATLDGNAPGTLDKPDIPRRSLGYKTSFRRNVIKVLRALWPDQMSTDPDDDGNTFWLNRLTWDTKYPQKDESYPHVMVNVQERVLHPHGIGDITIIDEDDGWEYHHWVVEGDIVFEIQSTEDYEMDLITDGLIVLLGMEDALNNALYDDEYFPVKISNKELRVGNSASGVLGNYESGTELRFYQTLSIPFRGQFACRIKQDIRTGYRCESVKIDLFTRNEHLRDVFNVRDPR